MLLSNQKIIEYANRIDAFKSKGYKIPFDLRRALKKNTTTLVEEYQIFDEARKEIFSGDLDEDKKNDEVYALLNNEIEVDIIQVPVNILSDIMMDPLDEDLIEFMLIDK